LGTCGTVQSDVKIGTMAVASKGSVLIQRNPDAFENPDEHKSVFDFYKVSKPIPADPELSALIS
jgi:uridine phosphorylase